MNFNFFKWVHDELVALRAAVARLETHTSSPESKPVPKPADLPAEFGPPAPVQPAQDPQALANSLYLQSNPQRADTAGGETPAPVAGDTLDFNQWNSVAVDMIGTVAKTYINCPAKTRLVTMITDAYASNYEVWLNGVKAGEFPPDASTHPMNVPEDAGSVEVKIVQEANSHIKMLIRDGWQ